MAHLPPCSLRRGGIETKLSSSKEQTMSAQRIRTSTRFIGRALAVFGAAVHASSAVENHRRPAKRDLEILGIDPEAFDRI